MVPRTFSEQLHKTKIARWCGLAYPRCRGSLKLCCLRRLVAEASFLLSHVLPCSPFALQCPFLGAHQCQLGDFHLDLRVVCLAFIAPKKPCQIIVELFHWQEKVELGKEQKWISPSLGSVRSCLWWLCTTSCYSVAPCRIKSDSLIKCQQIAGWQRAKIERAFLKKAARFSQIIWEQKQTHPTRA